VALVGDLGAMYCCWSSGQDRALPFFVSLIDQCETVLRLFLVRVNLVLERPDRTIQVSELFVHNPRFFFISAM